jgi:four helix bundle protein
MRETKVYADCYQTSIHIFNKTKSFPRHLRPTLGRKMEESVINCLLNIRKANVASQGRYRIDHLNQASQSLDDLRTLVNLSKDMQALNIPAYSEISNLTSNIGKQLGGFIKSEREKVKNVTAKNSQF